MASGQLSSFTLKSVYGINTGEKKGSGAYGAVYKVTVDGVPCIAKRLHDILVDPKVPLKQKASIQQKFHTLLSQLRHPNVVHFVGVHYGSNQDDMSLIMECLDTDLASYLETQPNIPIEVKLSILLDVSYGLLYLHTCSPPIIHRDLTAPNILLTRDKRAKIADLGVSKLLEPRTRAAMMQTKAPGTHFYMPPEALMENPKYDEKLDIFSFAHLALYVVNQVFPEVFEVPNTVHEETVQITKRRPAINEMCKDHCLHAVVMKCLQDNPLKRPTTLKLNEMMNHLCMKHPKEHQLEAEVQRLQSENKELELSLERTTKQFRNDSEALMADYQRSIERLHDAKADRDKYKNQYETLLAQRERTEHMGSQEEKAQELVLDNKQLHKKLKDIGLLSADGYMEINDLRAQVRELEQEKRTLQNEVRFATEALPKKRFPARSNSKVKMMVDAFRVPLTKFEPSTEQWRSMGRQKRSQPHHLCKGLQLPVKSRSVQRSKAISDEDIRARAESDPALNIQMKDAKLSNEDATSPDPTATLQDESLLQTIGPLLMPEMATAVWTGVQTTIVDHKKS